MFVPAGEIVDAISSTRSLAVSGPLERGIETKRDDAGPIARSHAACHRVDTRQRGRLRVGRQAAGPIERKHHGLRRFADRQLDSRRGQRGERDHDDAADQRRARAFLRRPVPPFNQQQCEPDQQQRAPQAVAGIGRAARSACHGGLRRSRPVQGLGRRIAPGEPFHG